MKTIQHHKQANSDTLVWFVPANRKDKNMLNRHRISSNISPIYHATPCNSKCMPAFLSGHCFLDFNCRYSRCEWMHVAQLATWCNSVGRALRFYWTKSSLSPLLEFENHDRRSWWKVMMSSPTAGCCLAIASFWGQGHLEPVPTLPDKNVPKIGLAYRPCAGVYMADSCNALAHNTVSVHVLEQQCCVSVQSYLRWIWVHDM